jgi:hypothetical protein
MRPSFRVRKNAPSLQRNPSKQIGLSLPNQKDHGFLKISTILLALLTSEASPQTDKLVE